MTLSARDSTFGGILSIFDFGFSITDFGLWVIGSLYRL